MPRTELCAVVCCLLLGAAGPAMMAANIGTSAPKSMLRTGEKWKDGGRIAGELIGFSGKSKISIEILNSKSGTSAAKIEAIPGTTVYFTPFLKAGEYDIVVKAEGFTEAKTKQIAVKSGADTIVNLEFGQ